MKRLLYISTARKLLSDSALDQILAKSRANNAACDVTGLLVVGGRRFLQALEGPAHAVDKTFERIQTDERHFALVKLHDQPISSRSFECWAMGFERGQRVPETATLSDQIAAIVDPISNATLKAYFTGFSASHSTAGPG